VFVCPVVWVLCLCLCAIQRLQTCRTISENTSVSFLLFVCVLCLVCVVFQQHFVSELLMVRETKLLAWLLLGGWLAVWLGVVWLNRMRLFVSSFVVCAFVRCLHGCLFFVSIFFVCFFVCLFVCLYVTFVPVYECTTDPLDGKLTLSSVSGSQLPERLRTDQNRKINQYNNTHHR